MEHRIDIARFECPSCGHWSTPPEEINTFANQMEKYEEVEAIVIPDSETTEIFIETLEQQHQGNTFTVQAMRKASAGDNELGLAPEVEPENYTKTITVARSYCTVAFQSHTSLSESNHIVLTCPNCNTQLYEARWKR